jgi:hypothetical protein
MLEEGQEMDVSDLKASEVPTAPRVVAPIQRPGFLGAAANFIGGFLPFIGDFDPLVGQERQDRAHGLARAPMVDRRAQIPDRAPLQRQPDRIAPYRPPVLRSAGPLKNGAAPRNFVVAPRNDIDASIKARLRSQVAKPIVKAPAKRAIAKAQVKRVRAPPSKRPFVDEMGKQETTGSPRRPRASIKRQHLVHLNFLLSFIGSGRRCHNL